MIQWLSIDRNTEQDEKGEKSMSDTYHFQVNLGGMLDVLSNHLYKSPDVFLRELLQNGVDVKTVSSMLGHFDAGFTLRTYTHATRQKQDEAAQTMGNFMEQVM